MSALFGKTCRAEDAPEKGGAGRRVYGNLASIRTSIYILPVMAVLFMAGAIFPQGGDIDEYARAGGRLAAFALFLNLAVFTYERFFAIRRLPGGGAPGRSLQLTQGPAEAEAVIRDALRGEMGFRPVSEEGGWVVMEKGLPCRWLARFYQASIVVCVLGLALTFLFAYEGTVTLSPGKAAAVEPEQRGRLSSLAGGQGPSPFKLKAAEFLTEYAEAPELDYPEGMLSRLATVLGLQRPRHGMKGGSLIAVDRKARIIVEEGGKAVKEKLVEINDPLKYGGYKFHLLDLDQVFKVRVENNPILLEARNNEEMLVPGLGFPIRFTVFRTGTVKRLDGAVEELRGHAGIRYAGGGEGKEEDLGRIAAGESVYLNGTRLTLAGVAESPILSYRYDPGMPVLWWGGILVLVAMSLRFFGSWQTAAYRLDASGAIVRLDLRISAKGVISGAGKTEKRLENILTRNDIRPEPLEDE